MNITVASIISLVIGFAVTALLGYVLIPVLHKLKFGQTILVDIGPKWHAKKQGTPTMGGIMFIIGTILAAVVTYLICKLTGSSAFSVAEEFRAIEYTEIFGGILLAVLFALVGFADDYIKVVKKRNLGLTEIQKTIPQLVIAVVYLACYYRVNGSSMYVPFVGDVDLHFFYWIFGVCVIYGAINAVNFTDGIDGLCGSVTLVTAVAFTVAAILYKTASVSILAAALAGACAGYLIWNHYPAKVMMGDTGSMFLGGLVVALAYAINMAIILLLFGFIYVVEAMSDVIQIGSIKIRHKKVFKMAPIHHHFEMCGWNEVKIVRIFTLVNAIACAIGMVLIYFGDNRIM